MSWLFLVVPPIVWVGIIYLREWNARRAERHRYGGGYGNSSRWTGRQ